MRSRQLASLASGCHRYMQTPCSPAGPALPQDSCLVGTAASADVVIAGTNGATHRQCIPGQLGGGGGPEVQADVARSNVQTWWTGLECALGSRSPAAEEGSGGGKAVGSYLQPCPPPRPAHHQARHQAASACPLTASSACVVRLHACLSPGQRQSPACLALPPPSHPPPPPPRPTTTPHSSPTPTPPCAPAQPRRRTRCCPSAPSRCSASLSWARASSTAATHGRTAWSCARA